MSGYAAKQYVIGGAQLPAATPMANHLLATPKTSARVRVDPVASALAQSSHHILGLLNVRRKRGNGFSEEETIPSFRLIPLWSPIQVSSGTGTGPTLRCNAL